MVCLFYFYVTEANETKTDWSRGYPESQLIDRIQRAFPPRNVPKYDPSRYPNSRDVSYDYPPSPQREYRRPPSPGYKTIHLHPPEDVNAMHPVR